MTLSIALSTLKSARWPEAIFGPDQSAIESSYREWAKLVHEDLVPVADKPAAHEAFLLLTKWREQAEAKVARGTYGDNRPAIFATLRTKTAVYDLTNLLKEQDIACLYEGVSDKGVPVVVKVCRSPANNDLMKAEADLLAKLPATLDPKHCAYFSNLLDSFETQNGRIKVRTNVFSFMTGAVSLAEVRNAYPKGLDPKDAAWMWNRMLEALHLLHIQGIVHANLTPDNFLIVPDTHQGVLIDFCCARKTGQTAKAINLAWNGFYPPEVLAKKPLDFSSDICMVGYCMNYLLGASPSSLSTVPNGVPLALAGLMKSCWLGQAHRSHSARQLHAEFKDVRKALGWSSAFRPFSLPSASS